MRWKPGSHYRCVSWYGMRLLRRRIKEYIMYQTECPFVGIGSPRQRGCLPPWFQMGEEQHSLESEGVEVPNSDDCKESLALCIFCVIVFTCSSYRFLKQRSLLWFGKNAAHTYDRPKIFRKRKNVVCANFLHRPVCKDFYRRILMRC